MQHGWTNHHKVLKTWFAAANLQFSSECACRSNISIFTTYFILWWTTSKLYSFFLFCFASVLHYSWTNVSRWCENSECLRRCESECSDVETFTWGAIWISVVTTGKDLSVLLSIFTITNHDRRHSTCHWLCRRCISVAELPRNPSNAIIMYIRILCACATSITVLWLSYKQ